MGFSNQCSSRTFIDINDADLRRLFKVYTTTIYLENVTTGALL